MISELWELVLIIAEVYDAFALARAIKLLGEEGEHFAERAEQIERDMRTHIENIR